jgi:ribosomal protein S12 methylthiotransferase accessory factor
VLNSDLAPKSYFSGTHRSLEPAATLARVRPLFSQFGITRIANLTGLDRIGVPVVMACRPNARSSAVFHGKGLNLDAAKASGAMEAIETWHAENAHLPLRYGSFGELSPRYRLCNLDGVPKLPSAGFCENEPMLWTEGHNLLGSVPIWVPFELVHAHSTLSGPPSSNCFATGTNGLASGNHPIEATSHALCEIIERDAVSLWRSSPAAQQDARRIDLDTIDDPSCRVLVEKLNNTRFDIGIFDITTDIGVATFKCLLVDHAEELGHIGAGAGCHPSREIALSRALTEAAQVRMTYILGSREDILAADYSREALALRNLGASAMLRRSQGARSFQSVGTYCFESFNREVDWLVTRFAAIGLSEVIIVDLTQPEFDLPVVRAIVPGLEGSDNHPGYTPGARALAIARRT